MNLLILMSYHLIILSQMKKMKNISSNKDLNNRNKDLIVYIHFRFLMRKLSSILNKYIKVNLLSQIKLYLKLIKIH